MKIEITKERLNEIMRYKNEFLLFENYDICKIIKIEFIEEERVVGFFKNNKEKVYFITEFLIQTPSIEEEEIFYYSKVIKEKIIKGYVLSYNKWDLYKARTNYLNLIKVLKIWEVY